MSKEAPSLLKLEAMTSGYVQNDPRGPKPDEMPSGTPASFVPFTAVEPYGFMRAFGDMPPIGPPWSQLTAYDLNEGTILWQVPNGDTEEMAAKGIHGTGNLGARSGMVVTAGGLVFIGTSDRRLRAYDEDTGKVVWEYEVSGPISGVPATYELDGRQYLAVGVGRSETTDASGESPSSEYVVFALPSR
jgi:quinoprotein glucose dehydrogenase